jgi:hypothetical protein
MKPYRYLRHQNLALSVMYDTMLFLVFVSLSGVLLLPVFYQQAPYALSQHHAHEEKVEDTLSLLLTSTSDGFVYTTAGTILDAAGETIGIDTSQDEGIYALLTTWFLGKEQLHKSYGQIIAENLVTQMNIPLAHNKTIAINLLTEDFTYTLSESIGDFLDDTLSKRYHYNFTAIWNPIISIPFGGYLSIGSTPPLSHRYVASQQISIPFLFSIPIGNTTIVFSKQSIKSFMTEYISNNGSAIYNISMIVNDIKRGDENKDNSTAPYRIAENLTNFFTSILITGLSSENESKRIPGFFELVIFSFFSPLIDLLEDTSDQMIVSSNDHGFGGFDVLFSSLNTSDQNPLIKGIQDSVFDHLLSNFGLHAQNITDAYMQLIHHVSLFVSSYIHTFLFPLMLSWSHQLLEYYVYIDSLSDFILDLIFDNLSLTTATVTLTIWERVI